MTWCLLVCVLPACATVLQRPLTGPCVEPDPQVWLAKAAKSLVFAPFSPRGPIYDQHRRHAVPVHIGPVDPLAQAVISYPFPERFAGGDSGFIDLKRRSFVYDDALAVVWLTASGDLARAQGLCFALRALQLPDGAWGFSFAAQDDGFYNAGYVRAGTVAWVVYALARYQHASADRQFVDTLERGLLWLQGQTDARGLVRAGRGRWIDGDTFDPDFDAHFSATEHQIDIWFAYAAAGQADPDLAARLQLPAASSKLLAALDAHLWLDGSERYAQGINADARDDTSALDAAGTWAALLDLARAKPGRAKAALAWVQRHHTVQVGGWQGLRPYMPDPPATWFVEGSLALALGWWRLGEQETARQAFAPAVQLACAGEVPLVYAPDWNVDFPLSPAAAPTLWFLLTGSELHGGKALVWTERAH